jgi:hypothetical protein
LAICNNKEKIRSLFHINSPGAVCLKRKPPFFTGAGDYVYKCC